MKLITEKLYTIPVKSPLITYKKLYKNLRSPIYNFAYSTGRIFHNKNFDANPNESHTSRFYSILPKFLKYHEYLGDIRFFQCEIWGKVVLEKHGSIGSEFIKIVKELPLKETLPYMTSGEAYSYCSHVSDLAIVREKITEDRWILNYCNLIKDDPKLAKKMKDPGFIKWYHTDKVNRRKYEKQAVV